MANALLTEYTNLLLEFKSYPKIERKRTFMEIAGYTYYENMCSNILQFFLDPSNEHGFKNLMLISLIRTAKPSLQFNTNFGNVKVTREHLTKTNNRLDLLIQTNDYVIGIENKIFHHLHNDLSDYKALIDSCVISHNSDTKKAIYLVLSLNKLTKLEDIKKVKENEFINITYNDLFKNIRENIGKYLQSSNISYTNYLTDFMKTIENLTSSSLEDRELRKYFSVHAKDIIELKDRFAEYEKSLYRKLYTLKEHLSAEPFILNLDDKNVYEDEFIHCVYYNIPVQEHIITVDAVVNFNGWEIWLSAVDRQSEDFLINTLLKAKEFSHLAGREIKELYGRNRIIIRTFNEEFDNTVEEISTISIQVLNLLTNIENYKNRVEKNNTSQTVNS